MNENVACRNELAKNFNEENGIVVYYKILAIESALLCAGIKKNDKVLISSMADYSIFETIIKLEGIPIIVILENQLAITKKELEHTLKRVRDIKYLIISHQFGITQSMREIKKLLEMM